MTVLLIIAGLTDKYFERTRRISGKTLAPGGHVIFLPNKTQGGYDADHAEKLQKRAFDYACTLKEDVPVQTLLIYVDYKDNSTQSMLESFFPFALPLPLALPLLDFSNGNTLKKSLNDFETELILSAQHLRSQAVQVAAHTQLPNLTPILLPLRNFSDEALVNCLRSLYLTLGTAHNVAAAIDDAVTRFIQAWPWVKKGTEVRRCLSDGILYFQSPGKERHGYFRHSGNGGHKPSCLLSARSRLGGWYHHAFHFDCEPVKGKLDKDYPGCHGQKSAPKKQHVNIAPNDYII